MKKAAYITISAVLCASIILYMCLGLFFGGRHGSYGSEYVLRVYSWEEYISEEDEELGTIDVVKAFESYCRDELDMDVRVEYSTFGTNENMYNELNMSKTSAGYAYDLVCPSEYMIMKMMREDMLVPLDKSRLPVYYGNASGYIQNLFDSLTVDGKRVSDYAASYMWGTMGFVYDPEKVDEEAAKHWSLVWDEAYKGKSTIKDSVRDSYVLASGYVHSEELLELADRFGRGELSAEDYNRRITDIFNDTDAENVNAIGKALSVLNSNIFGYEVDSGKKDMAQGKITINFCWSGDGVYTMDSAEGAYDEFLGSEPLYLNYAVPEEGSNIWFDGWVMPKGANVELASLFIDFISRPEIAVHNMAYVGYTPAIAGDAMFENAVDWYGYDMDSFDISLDGVETTADGASTVYTRTEKADLDAALADGETEAADTVYKSVRAADGSIAYFVSETPYALNDQTGEFEISGETEEFEVFPVDLSYFFGELDGYDSAIILTAELGRQFFCQYPDLDTVNRCTVMKSLTDEETELLNDMWINSKISNIPALPIAIGAIILVLTIAVAVTLSSLYKKGLIFQPRAPKGYTLKSIDLHGN